MPYHLCGFLLTLAEAELFRPLWSAEILAEVERTLVSKRGLAPGAARRRVAVMNEAFPGATVDGYADLSSRMKCHRKDRHVLAAAVRGGAQLLVTDNLKDFPEDAAKPYDIEVVHPDRFLFDQLDLDPETTVGCIATQTGRYKTPRMDQLELMRCLRPVVPNFAQFVGGQFQRGEPVLTSHAWLAQSTDEEAFRAFAPEGVLDLTTPQGVGFSWFSAILNLTEPDAALDALSLRPSDWNYRELAGILAGYALASGVELAIEAPDRMVFMRFLTDPGSSGQVVEGGVIKGDILVLTLVLHDGSWKVFSLGPEFPWVGHVFIDLPR